MEIHELNQIDARNGHLCTNVQLSQSKAMMESEEKPDEDMMSVIS